MADLPNPYNVTIDWDLVGLTNMEDNISVWDDANSDWKTWDKSAQSGIPSGGLIAPYQGFWVQANFSGSGSITIQVADKSGTGTFYRPTDDERGSFSILASTNSSSSENFISFHQDALAENSAAGKKVYAISSKFAFGIYDNIGRRDL